MLIDIGIAPKLLMNEFDKPRPDGFLECCPQAQMSKTMTLDDLKNEVATTKRS